MEVSLCILHIGGEENCGTKRQFLSQKPATDCTRINLEKISFHLRFGFFTCQSIARVFLNVYARRKTLKAKLRDLSL